MLLYVLYIDLYSCLSYISKNVLEKRGDIIQDKTALIDQFHIRLYKDIKYLLLIMSNPTFLNNAIMKA
ncbi:36860_t:CDS:2, partial [Racocetra persica]